LICIFSFMINDCCYFLLQFINFTVMLRINSINGLIIFFVKKTDFSSKIS